MQPIGQGNSGGETTPDVRIDISNFTSFEGDEGTTTFTFTLSTTAPSEKPISIDYRTESGTAEEVFDFVAANGTVIIPVGEREREIEVEIIPDISKEDDETFKVILSNPINVTIRTGEGQGTIRNDDTEIVVSGEGYSTPDNYAGYELVWRDEFVGTTIDPDCWTHETGGGGWGNVESQTYTSDAANSYISNGNLVIEARDLGGGNYSSARMITRGKKEFKYGRIDIRAILPEGQGIWPALWMLGANHGTVGWPACGEIDIMELLGHQPSTIHGTAHWGANNSNHQFKGNSKSLSGGQKFSDEYHVFSIIWAEDVIRWYVDDVQYFSLAPGNVNGSNYPFNDEFFFIFNIAVGGQWPGYPDETTVFPQRMVVDYIRVFQ